MDTSFTDSPIWIKKMKMRFAILDVDKNGIFDSKDLATVARNLAAYRNEGPDEEKHYFKVIQATSLADEKGVTEEEFIERAKTFVSQPDAKERVKVLVDAMFKIMDTKGNGTVSYEEFSQFQKSFHIEQEMIDKFFKSADTNGDGVIDYQENSANFTKFFFSAEY